MKIKFFEVNKIFITDISCGDNCSVALSHKGKVFRWG